jgi:phytoene desaturase
MTSERYDALVIGAGAGGVCAAARLSHHGYRTLLVDRLDRIGGRASTKELEGFKLNVGAVGIEFGGVLEETFDLVGAEFAVNRPDPSIMYRIKGRDIAVSKGGWSRLIGLTTRGGTGLVSALSRGGSGELPDESVTLEEWVNRLTRSTLVRSMFRNLCGALFAVNSNEISARAFLTYFTKKSAFRNFGFAAQGTGNLLTNLADAAERDGATVWLESEVTALHAVDGRVASATVRHDGSVYEIEAELVISNAGPAATVALCGAEHFDPAYLAQLDRDLQPAAAIVVHFTTTHPLVKAPGLLTFSATTRVCNMANMTAACPDMAPAGQHLYTAYGIPIPAIGDFDEEAEIAATIQDLRDEFKDFDARARILSVHVMRDEFAAQRTVVGRDVPRETAFENLWNVGDAVREYGNAGTEACAESAKLVVETILDRHGESLGNPPAPGLTIASNHAP